MKPVVRLTPPAMALLTVLVMLGAGAAPAHAQEAFDRFENLRDRWTVTPSGSAVEQAIEDSIQTLVVGTFGDSIIAAFRRYVDAPVGSEEESAALSEAQDGAAAVGVPWDRAGAMLSAYLILSGEEGEAVPADTPARSGLVVGMVDNKTNAEPIALGVTLRSTRESATAGGTFGVLGVISNQSDRAVWITDVTTKLLPPPEIWGETPGGSVGAFFPTGPAGTRETVRIDPRGSYPVIWRLDPRTGFREASDEGQSWLNFIQFQPGTYRFYAIVHAWPEAIDGSSPDVTNLSESQIVVGEAAIPIGLPISILMIGGALGGVFAVLLRVLTRLVRAEKPVIGWWRYLGVSLALGVLIAVVGTILISRLGGMRGFVSLTINDLWGAVATGVVLQWIGLRGLIDKAVADENGEDSGSEPEAEPAAVGT